MKKNYEAKTRVRTTLVISEDTNEKLKLLMSVGKITKTQAIRQAIHIIYELYDKKFSLIDKKGEKIKFFLGRCAN